LEVRTVLKDIIVFCCGQRADSKDAVVSIAANDVVEDLCRTGPPKANANLSILNERIVMDRRSTVRPHYVDSTPRAGDHGIPNHGGCIVDQNAIRAVPKLETAHYDIVGFDLQESFLWVARTQDRLTRPSAS
jgi:hypothetical protein